MDRVMNAFNKKKNTIELIKKNLLEILKKHHKEIDDIKEILLIGCTTLVSKDQLYEIKKLIESKDIASITKLDDCKNDTDNIEIYVIVDDNDRIMLLGVIRYYELFYNDELINSIIASEIKIDKLKPKNLLKRINSNK